MKWSRTVMAGLGRTVIVAFAAQVVAGAMCLMPAEAVASPQLACVMKHAASSPSHVRHACPHCDAPTQAVSQIDISHGLQAPALLPVAVVMPVSPAPSARLAAVPVPRILAPPDSRSLILHHTLRIRI